MNDLAERMLIQRVAGVRSSQTLYRMDAARAKGDWCITHYFGEVDRQAWLVDPYLQLMGERQHVVVDAPAR